MKIRFAAAASLLALALPLAAQTDAPAQAPAAKVEAVFYKAYYLEKGQRDYSGASALYEEFLAKAPAHKLAKEAAKQQFRLLERTGQAKKRDAFKAKYKDLLGNLANATTGQRPARGEGEQGRGEGGQRGQRGEGGQRGQGGQRRNRGGIFGLMRNETKLADMSEEQMTELKSGIEGASEMIDRMRGRMGDEVADKLEAAAGNLKKALDAGKMEDAQKALDGLREAFPMRRRGGNGGRGGEAGGAGEAGEAGRRGRNGRNGRNGGGGGNAEAGKGGGGGGN